MHGSPIPDASAAARLRGETEPFVGHLATVVFYREPRFQAAFVHEVKEGRKSWGSDGSNAKIWSMPDQRADEPVSFEIELEPGVELERGNDPKSSARRIEQFAGAFFGNWLCGVVRTLYGEAEDHKFALKTRTTMGDVSGRAIYGPEREHSYNPQLHYHFMIESLDLPKESFFRMEEIKDRKRNGIISLAELRAKFEAGGCAQPIRHALPLTTSRPTIPLPLPVPVLPTADPTDPADSSATLFGMSLHPPLAGCRCRYSLFCLSLIGCRSIFF